MFEALNKTAGVLVAEETLRLLHLPQDPYMCALPFLPRRRQQNYCIYTPVRPSVHLSIHQSGWPAIHPSVHLSVCLSIHQSGRSSIHKSIHPFICPSIHNLFINSFISIFIYSSIQTSIYPSVYLLYPLLNLPPPAFRKKEGVSVTGSDKYSPRTCTPFFHWPTYCWPTFSHLMVPSPCLRLFFHWPE